MKKITILFVFLSLFISSVWALDYDSLKNDPKFMPFQKAERLSFDAPFTIEGIRTLGFENHGPVSVRNPMNIYLQHDDKFSFYGLRRNLQNPMEYFLFTMVANGNKIHELHFRFTGNKNFNLLVANLSRQLKNPSFVKKEKNSRTAIWGINYYRNNDPEKEVRVLPIVTLEYNTELEEGELTWVSPEARVQTFNNTGN